MTYSEAFQYLSSLINYERIPVYNYKEALKLERIRELLVSVGNPADSLRCIHVAGTKGKGSTCVFTAYILREAGYRVGFYTSPHLSDFRERIRILNPRHSAVSASAEGDFEGMIPEGNLLRLVERVKPVIERLNSGSIYGPLSFFEVYTAMAFMYFKEEKVDFAVLETGMGGRLDATNVVKPLVAALTPISYEHTQKLGNTLKEIAAEKAGIIKRKKSKGKSQKLIVISAPQEKEAIEVIREKCIKVGAKLYEVDKDITYQKTKDSFSVKGMLGEYGDLRIALLGKHQLVNAAVSVGIIEALIPFGVKSDLRVIRRGLSNTRWPVRCEVISRDPMIILDGAQNIASAKAIKEAVKENFNYQKLILVLGISDDKDIQGVCNEFKGFADQFILTQADNPRATSADALAGHFQGKELYITKSVKEAKALVYRLTISGSFTLECVTLFVAGELRNAKI